MSDADEEPAIRRHSAEAAIINIQHAKRWDQRASMGWTLEVVGGFRDFDDAWIRLMLTPTNSIFKAVSCEISMMSSWLNRFGWRMIRHSVSHPAVFRVVPGMVMTGAEEYFAGALDMAKFWQERAKIAEARIAELEAAAGEVSP